ncbi:MAG: hypothetical protein Q8P41_08355 [Pseudomonadota bacterium]|nr:hypothetical protein [Pseudomonadota bacterium]
MILALVGPALASACCVGSVSDLPAQLGRCERFGAALGVAQAVELGAHDAHGAWGATSDGWSQTVATLGVAGRWARWGSASLALPAVFTARTAQDGGSLGGGVGDLALVARIEPWEEGGGPRPAFTVGIVAPTGRDWAHAQDPRGADVTGQGTWAPTAGIALERTGATWPWRLGIEASGAGMAAASASVGRYLGTRWTLTGALSSRVEWSAAGLGVRTGADLRVIHGKPGRWRAWLGVGSDLPFLGRAAHGEARATAGMLLVR